MIERFSPEGRASLDVLKDFIRSTIGTALLKEQALKLAGLPQADIDEGLAAVCHELALCFAQDGRRAACLTSSGRTLANLPA
jgi:hypothetical protein